MQPDRGQVAFGDNLSKAFELAQEVENICHQYVIALKMGEPKNLSFAEMKKILEKVFCILYVGAQGGTHGFWEWLGNPYLAKIIDLIKPSFCLVFYFTFTQIIRWAVTQPAQCPLE